MLEEHLTVNKDLEPRNLAQEFTSLELLLDIHNMDMPRPEEAQGFFTIKLDRSEDVFDAGTNSFDVYPGTQVALQVVPSVHGASDGAAAVSASVRDCRFAAELQESEVFERYSWQNCMMECKLKRVTEAFGCKPWYLAALSGSKESPEICTGAQVRILCICTLWSLA